MVRGGTKIDSDNWKKILIDIYRFAPSNWGESIKMGKYDPRHPLAEKYNFKHSELGNIMVFLEDQGLIKTETSNYKEYSAQWILTEKGFDVALELEKQAREIREKKRFEKLQLGIIILTAILMITGIINIFF